MSRQRSPQAIAAEVHRVIGAYRARRDGGARHDQAFLAAVAAYRSHHPDVPRTAAAHTVTQMMRDMDTTRAA